ncbi:hypothetical protein R3P38DRAFT_2760841 [Favolaschia claudopus]|uniref:Uncharacterized protein n=1 Tax=Favolaschia claudopus TaxID=2862362 RepID=A0AAW0DUC9_9AGAR
MGRREEHKSYQLEEIPAGRLSGATAALGFDNVAERVVRPLTDMMKAKREAADCQMQLSSIIIDPTIFAIASFYRQTALGKLTTHSNLGAFALPATQESSTQAKRKRTHAVPMLAHERTLKDGTGGGTCRAAAFKICVVLAEEDFVRETHGVRSVLSAGLSAIVDNTPLVCQLSNSSCFLGSGQRVCYATRKLYGQAHVLFVKKGYPMGSGAIRDDPRSLLLQQSSTARSMLVRQSVYPVAHAPESLASSSSNTPPSSLDFLRSSSKDTTRMYIVVPIQLLRCSALSGIHRMTGHGSRKASFLPDVHCPPSEPQQMNGPAVQLQSVPRPHDERSLDGPHLDVSFVVSTTRVTEIVRSLYYLSVSSVRSLVGQALPFFPFSLPNLVQGNCIGSGARAKAAACFSQTLRVLCKVAAAAAAAEVSSPKLVRIFALVVGGSATRFDKPLIPSSQLAPESPGSVMLVAPYPSSAFRTARQRQGEEEERESAGKGCFGVGVEREDADADEYAECEPARGASDVCVHLLSAGVHGSDGIVKSLSRGTPVLPSAMGERKLVLVPSFSAGSIPYRSELNLVMDDFDHVPPFRASASFLPALPSAMIPNGQIHTGATDPLDRFMPARVSSLSSRDSSTFFGELLVFFWSMHLGHRTIVILKGAATSHGLVCLVGAFQR